jgi:nicotinamidase-related amidase
MKKKLTFKTGLICFLISLTLITTRAFSQNRYLIVLDVQEYYTNNKLTESAAQKLIDSINYVINNTNTYNVIYIKSTHKLLNLSLSAPFVYTTTDTAAMCFDKRLNAVSKQIFTKEKSSAFSVKALNDYLKQNNAKEIVIIGLLAEKCVYESLIAGRELGYTMYTMPEAIVGKSEKSKDKVMSKLIKKGIKIADINTFYN